MRSICEYCGGNTKINDYGNCVACGAPDRSTQKRAEQKKQEEEWMRNYQNDLCNRKMASMLSTGEWINSR